MLRVWRRRLEKEWNYGSTKVWDEIWPGDDTQYGICILYSHICQISRLLPDITFGHAPTATVSPCLPHSKCTFISGNIQVSTLSFHAQILDIRVLREEGYSSFNFYIEKQSNVLCLLPLSPNQAQGKFSSKESLLLLRKKKQSYIPSTCGVTGNFQAEVGWGIRSKLENSSLV